MISVVLICFGLILSLIGALQTLELPIKVWLMSTAVWGGISEQKAKEIENTFKKSVKTARLFLIFGTLLQIIGTIHGIMV